MRAALHHPARLPVCVADQLAELAKRALLAELETWPKPGLVSLVDSGSHRDMNAETFLASVASITPFYGALAVAGASGSDLEELRAIGLEAERAMLAETGGVNTHRGAIFSLGLLCAAAGASWSGRAGSERVWSATILSRTVRQLWGAAILRGPIPLQSHGTRALLRFGAGGARAQAASGFSQALEVGLPSLRLGRELTREDPNAARVQSFFALLATTEDTNLLHRGGVAGLRFAQHAATEFIRRGGVGWSGWQEAALRIHHAFVSRQLSPGGCADLLAVALFLDGLEQEA